MECFLDSRLGYVKVPRIEEAFGSRNLLPSTALDLKFYVKINLAFSEKVNNLRI